MAMSTTSWETRLWLRHYIIPRVSRSELKERYFHVFGIYIQISPLIHFRLENSIPLSWIFIRLIIFMEESTNILRTSFLLCMNIVILTTFQGNNIISTRPFSAQVEFLKNVLHRWRTSVSISHLSFTRIRLQFILYIKNEIYVMVCEYGGERM